MPLSVKDAREEPVGQARIADLRAAGPEIRWQIAIDMQMSELQLDVLGLARKITARVARANIKTGDLAAAAVCPNHHGPLHCMPNLTHRMHGGVQFRLL